MSTCGPLHGKYSITDALPAEMTETEKDQMIKSEGPHGWNGREEKPRIKVMSEAGTEME